MYRYRELLMSLLASAMFTASFAPAAGEVAYAGIVNASSARNALESALATAAGAGMPAPHDYAPADVTAPRATLVVAGSQASAPISQERFRLVATVAGHSPIIAPMNQRVSDGLGLTSGTTLNTRQLVNRVQELSLTRAFAVDAAGSSNVLIFRMVARSGWFYACDLNGTLRSSIRVENATVIVQDVNDPSVRAAYEEELRFWAVTTLPEIPSEA